MLDPVIRDLARHEREMDLEDFVSDELWSLAETPEGEGLTHEVEFWCIGIDEELEADEIIARLEGVK